MSAVDEYFEKANPAQQAELQRVRQIIRREVPEVEEVISYGMPGFKYKGQSVVWVGAFKDHMSLFPGPVTKELAKKLTEFKMRKGTIQFTIEHPLPEALIVEIVQSRLAEITPA